MQYYLALISTLSTVLGAWKVEYEIKGKEFLEEGFRGNIEMDYTGVEWKAKWINKEPVTDSILPDDVLIYTLQIDRFNATLPIKAKDLNCESISLYLNDNKDLYHISYLIDPNNCSSLNVIRDESLQRPILAEPVLPSSKNNLENQSLLVKYW